MKKEVYDYVIIGSGPGGATAAKELAKKGKKVLVVEKGLVIKPGQLGNLWDAVFYPGFYKRLAVFNQSIEGTIIYATENQGGSSVFSCGNLVRTDVFSRYGIDLSDEFVEAEKEIRVAPACLNPTTKRIMEVSGKLGYLTAPMPKGFVGQCNACGNCVVGCSKGAKWDARIFLDEAMKSGAKLIRGEVFKILFTSSYNARGVKLKTGEEIECDRVIVAAGALSTPSILQNSGICAGIGLFIDFFNVTYGISENSPSFSGVSMPTLYQGEDFILSLFVDHWSQKALFCPLFWNLFQGGFHRERIIGIMAKINDDRVGGVLRGRISKYATNNDLDKLKAGETAACKILRHLGCKNLITTKVARGAHPGGTAALEDVVDKNLKVRGTGKLYVCDASVFPKAPGMPPILTIIALAKRLAKYLIK